MPQFLKEESESFRSGGLDLATFGQRLRHLRRARNLTLAELGERVGRAPSALSLLENGREEARLNPLFRDLGLPYVKAGARVPGDVLEHLVALYGELRRQRTRPTATPEEARIANAELRDAMRARGNYFPEIERQAAEALDAVGYRGGALSQSTLMAIVGHHGFTVSYADDLPRSVRSVTDLRHRRIYP